MEFGIRGRIQNPLRTVLYSLKWGDREGDAFTPDYTKLEFIDDFVSFIWAAVLAVKMAFEETLISRDTQR